MVALKRRLRPTLGDRPLTDLEPRVAPTVLFGPQYNPQFGTTTTFSENTASHTMQATISVAPGAQPVSVIYQALDRATVDPTAAGEHNNGAQTPRAVIGLVILPGQSVTLAISEGAAGTASDGQITGTQFDVMIDPVSDLTGSLRVNTAGIIAYNESLPRTN